MPFDGTDFWAPHAPVVVPFYDRVGRALVDARALVERGWSRGKLHRGRAVCAVAAIGLSTNYFYALPLQEIVIEWNDTAESRADVLKVFDAAIANRGRPRLRFRRKAVAEACAVALVIQIA